MLLIFRGRLRMAVWVMLAHYCYLRPSECQAIRHDDLVAPSSAVSTCWTVVVAPSVVGRPTKTGTVDETVRMDMDDMAWLGPVLAKLKEHTAPGQSVWDFTYPMLTAELREISALLGIDIVPYQLRHSGPSWDATQQRRTLEQIQKRGRWKTFSSVCRYEKGGRSLQSFQELDVDVRGYCETAVALLSDVMLGKVAAPRL